MTRALLLLRRSNNRPRLQRGPIPMTASATTTSRGSANADLRLASGGSSLGLSAVATTPSSGSVAVGRRLPITGSTPIGGISTSGFASYILRATLAAGGSSTSTSGSASIAIAAAPVATVRTGDDFSARSLNTSKWQQVNPTAGSGSGVNFTTTGMVDLVTSNIGGYRDDGAIWLAEAMTPSTSNADSDIVSTFTLPNDITATFRLFSRYGALVPYRRGYTFIFDCGNSKVGMYRTDDGFNITALYESAKNAYSGVNSGSVWKMRLVTQTLGTGRNRVAGRLWLASAAEPTAWTFDVVDTISGYESGFDGIQAYPGNTATSQTWKVDDLTISTVGTAASAPNSGAIGVTDNGNGTYVFSGAGVTDNGDGTYTLNDGSVADNGNGTYTVTYNTATTYALSATGTMSSTGSANLGTTTSNASGFAMPTANVSNTNGNWVMDYYDDFATPFAVGAFPGTYGQRLAAYDGYNDTSGAGTYDPKQTIYVQDSKLITRMRTINGSPRVGATIINTTPGSAFSGRTYGRYSVCMRGITEAGTGGGYKVAFMLWPTSDNWPTDGEYDWPETDFGSGSYAGAFHHYARSSGGQDVGYAPTNVLVKDWHVYTIEWGPGKIAYFVDGNQVLASSNYVAAKPMRWTLQCETNLGQSPTASEIVRVEVDWIAQWSRG